MLSYLVEKLQTTGRTLLGVHCIGCTLLSVLGCTHCLVDSALFLVHGTRCT